MKRFILPAALLVMGLFLYVIMGDTGWGDKPEPPVEAPKPVAQPAPRKAPPESVGLPVPKAPPVIEKPKTVKQVKAIGLLEQSGTWVDSAISKRDWKRIPADDDEAHEDGPTFVNQRGTKMVLKLKNGMVTSAYAEFADNSLSADVQVLTTPLIGQRDSFPVHMEGDEAGAEFDKSFDTADGRTFYIRGKLRTSGSGPPWGPGSFEVSLTPFKD